jgi:type VI secretion system protein ImpE
MSETEEGAGALFRAGKLDEAMKAANAAVRKAPGELGPRVLLAELLLFAGNPERADVLLDAAGDIEPQAALVVAEFRQLLRADMARRQLHREGRVPEFLGEPTPSLAAVLEARVALRAGDAAAAAELAERAEAIRPRAAGRLGGGGAFDDFRDADDLCAGFFEVLTTTGKYFWIPTERVETVTFHPPKRARDLFWRRVSMSVRGGPDGDVYLPAIYPADADAQPADAYRLGRATDWSDPDAGPVRGMGQRAYLAGEELVSIMDLAEITFDAPVAGAPAGAP